MRITPTFNAPITCAVAACYIGVIAAPVPAAAQNWRNVGRAAAAVAGAAVVLGILGGSGPSARARASTGSSSARRSRSTNTDTASESSSSNSSPSTSANRAAERRRTAQQEAELRAISAANNMESDRNVRTAIDEFVKDLRCRHERLLTGRRDKDCSESKPKEVRVNVKIATGLDINEVTSGAISSAVEDAYRAAGLQAFERYNGEMWTRDRLTVFILRHARKSLPPYFEGAGARGPDIGDLKTIFAKSARSVYANALETAELIGVSHSFDRFIRTIYENSDHPDGNLWTTGADGRYERLMSDLIDRVPMSQNVLDRGAQSNANSGSSAITGVGRQFLARYRARRSLYDCVSASYSNMLGSRSGTAQGLIPASRVTPEGETSSGNGAAGDQTPLDQAALAARAETIWKRMQDRVAQTCNPRVPEAVRLVANGEIAPQPARFDNALSGVGDTISVRDPQAIRLPGQF